MDDTTTDGSSKGFELFLKLLVIGLGIFLGLLASSIIGIMTGLVPFLC